MSEMRPYTRATTHRGAPSTSRAWPSSELGDTHGCANSLCSLGSTALAIGDVPRASELCRESLALFREIGDKDGIANCLEGLAQAASAQQRAVRAARLYGAAEALREVIGAPMQPTDRIAYDRAVA